MKDPRKPKMHGQEQYRNIPTASPYKPEDMDKSMKNYEGTLEQGHHKMEMPSHNRAKMPQMKP
jgi:hypothetical protein